MGELVDILLAFKFVKRIMPSAVRDFDFDGIDIIVGFDYDDKPRYYSVREVCETRVAHQCAYLKLYKYIGSK